MSEPPRRRREDGALDFHGGPRDGDRMCVKDNPTIFDVPVPFESPRRPGVSDLIAGDLAPGKDMYARYELRDGAYHYLGQVEKD